MFTVNRNYLNRFETGLLLGPALQLISGFVTAPDVTQTALTMASGDSLTVKQTNGGSLAWLLTCWVDAQVRGILRIKSPAQHDNVQGLRFATIASEVQPMFDPAFATPL